jgi:hypothetical protein
MFTSVNNASPLPPLVAMQTTANTLASTITKLSAKEVRETKDVTGRRAIAMMLNCEGYYGLTFSGSLALQALDYAMSTGRLASSQAILIRDSNLPQIFRKLEGIVKQAGEREALYAYVEAWLKTIPMAF